MRSYLSTGDCDEIAQVIFSAWLVFLLLGLQLPGILETSLMAAEIDPNVEIWMLFTDIILIYAALMLVRFGWPRGFIFR